MLSCGRQSLPRPFHSWLIVAEVFPSPHSCPHSGGAQQPRVSLSEPVAARSMTSSSAVTHSSALHFSHPHGWLPKAMSLLELLHPKIAESAPHPPHSLQALQPTLSPLWDAGSRLSRTQGLASSPAAPSVFVFLPPQLRFPGPSFEHSSASIRSSLGRPSSGPALAGSPPALEESQQPPAWRCPPPPPQPGAKLGKPALGGDPCCQTCCSPAQLASACLCPADRLPSLPSPLQPPSHHLTHHPSPAPSLLSGQMAHLPPPRRW